ncbi:MAG: glycerophosphodiester phosphodiesterase family protein [Pseudomonadota bacterium]
MTRATSPILRGGYLILLGLAGLITACTGTITTSQTQAKPTAYPIIIAHRGASGDRPEHTLEAYQLAIEQGADFIEPDLVMTKDGVLIARHDRYLSTTTNVIDHPEFAGRRRRVETPFGSREDWWAEDFTLAEIKTLRARQPFPGRSIEYDDQFEIPTFDEVLALVTAEAGKGRTVGVYPETKSPSHHESIGLAMDGPLLSALDAADIANVDIPIFIQSFEAGILRELNMRSDWPLIQLVSGDPRAAAAGYEPSVSDIAAYADGIGPNKRLLWSDRGEPSTLLAEAKSLGLQIHPWTIRDDRIGAGYDTVEDELAALFALGVDGVFTDFPATAARVRDQ